MNPDSYIPAIENLKDEGEAKELILYMNESVDEELITAMKFRDLLKLICNRFPSLSPPA